VHVVEVLVPYLIGAAATLLVQMLIQFYVVPRVETRKRREDRFERNVLEPRELLTTQVADRAHQARLEQSIFRALRQKDYGPEFDQANVVRGIEDQGRKAQQLTWEYIGFVRARVIWLAERVTDLTPKADEIIKLQVAYMRYLLQAERVAGWSMDDESTDDEFEAAWQAEQDARNGLTEQVRLLAGLPHPPRAPRGIRAMRRFQAARIARSLQTRPGPAASVPHETAREVVR
jgi:hypothetical protein